MHISKRSSGTSRIARATAEQVLAAHEEGQLAAVDDDLLDGLVEARPSPSASALPSRSATSSK